MAINQDHIKHFTACFIVAGATSSIEAACGASYGLSFMAGTLAGGAIGVGKEYGDECAPGNKWDWSDITADAVGAVLGAAVGSLVSLVHQ